MSNQPQAAAKADAPAPAPAPAPDAKPASVLKERWTQWVALTTTVLAVCAAISSLKAGGYSTRTQLATTRENDTWAQYQSKSIKQNLLVVERSLLQVQGFEARTPDAQKAIAARLAAAESDIARYDKEKVELKDRAEKIQQDEASFQRIGGAFGLAVMLLQIAIMLSSVGALIKRPAMWVVGLCFGAIGLGYMARGFGLF
jgi:hypothetical protein